MVNGPNIIVPRATPVICDELPVTEGIFSAESTKAKAPAMAIRGLISGLSATIRLTEAIPKQINGIAISHHIPAQTGGRKPSMMCILKRLTGIKNIRKTKNALFIYISLFI